MIEIPWQLAVALALGNFIIITALIMQLRDRADRQVQRDNEIVRSTKKAITDGIQLGHEVYLSHRRRNHEEAKND